MMNVSIANSGSVFSWTIFLHTIVRIIIINTLFTLSGIYGQETVLTLEEAIAISQGGSMEKHRAQWEYQYASNQMNLFQAELRPQVVLQASLPHFYKSTTPVVQPNGSIFFQPISQDNSLVSLNLTQKILPTNTIVFAQTHLQRFQDFSGNLTHYNNSPFRVGITQSFNHFNQDRWNQKIFKIDNLIAQKHLTASDEKVAAQVTSAFFEVLMAQVDLQIARTNKANNEKLYRIALERYDLGKISKSDLLQLELGVSTARQHENRASRSMIRATAHLNEVMNSKITIDTMSIVHPPSIPRLEMIDANMLAIMAWDNRPEQWEFRKLILEAEQAMDKARREHGWQARLTAQIGLTARGNSISESYEQTKMETLVEVGIQVPILDGGRRKYSIQQARSSHEYLQSETTYSESMFKQQIRQLVLQFNHLQQETRHAHQSYQIAEDRYNIVNQRYLLDDINITEMTLAFGERDQAWRNYIDVLQAFWITYYTLRQLTLYNFDQIKY